MSAHRCGDPGDGPALAGCGQYSLWINPDWTTTLGHLLCKDSLEMITEVEPFCELKLRIPLRLVRQIRNRLEKIVLSDKQINNQMVPITLAVGWNGNRNHNKQFLFRKKSVPYRLRLSAVAGGFIEERVVSRSSYRPSSSDLGRLYK
ncbi:hypothetical protein TNCV_690391 [Trichonephila clavipes]|nr:hypothetical protein TNCV_690391 [Trichonephila clavipes]